MLCPSRWRLPQAERRDPSAAALFPGSEQLTRNQAPSSLDGSHPRPGETGSFEDSVFVMRKPCGCPAFTIACAEVDGSLNSGGFCGGGFGKSLPDILGNQLIDAARASRSAA